MPTKKATKARAARATHFGNPPGMRRCWTIAGKGKKCHIDHSGGFLRMVQGNNTIEVCREQIPAMRQALEEAEGDDLFLVYEHDRSKVSE